MTTNDTSFALQEGLLAGSTTSQRPFLKKLVNLIASGGNSLFEMGYYCNFPLRSGYPKLLDASGLQVARDIRYLPDTSTPAYHSLDVYSPEGQPDQKLPVFIFIHGGAWRSADKSKGLHVHENLCVRLARKGVVCVNVNHSLAPKVKFPTAENDVSQAVKWVHEHIGEYGGDRERIFLSGHSSGGHIAALLATDSHYLGNVGLDATVIKGVVSVSGVMDIHDFFHHSSFHKNFSVRPYFGHDIPTHDKASPINHADRSTPPFLLLHAAEHDEGLDEQANAMEARLKELDVPVKRIAYAGADHFLILSKINEAAFTLTDDIFQFISTIQ